MTDSSRHSTQALRQQPASSGVSLLSANDLHYFNEGMYAQPGKKLLFMGGEFGQWHEWNHDASLDWHLLEFAPHLGLLRWVTDLNRPLPAHASPLCRRLRLGGLCLDRLQRRRAQCGELSAPGEVP